MSLFHNLLDRTAHVIDTPGLLAHDERSKVVEVPHTVLPALCALVPDEVLRPAGVIDNCPVLGAEVSFASRAPAPGGLPQWFEAPASIQPVFLPGLPAPGAGVVELIHTYASD